MFLISKRIANTHQQFHKTLDLLNKNSGLISLLSGRTYCDADRFTDLKYEFIKRHIGPSEEDKLLMLEKIGVKVRVIDN